MLGEAVGHLKNTPAGKRIGLFRKLKAQIEDANPGWEATENLLEGGGRVFSGKAGRTLVIDDKGRMFLGDNADLVPTAIENGMIVIRPVWQAFKEIL